MDILQLQHKFDQLEASVADIVSNPNWLEIKKFLIEESNASDNASQLQKDLDKLSDDYDDATNEIDQLEASVSSLKDDVKNLKSILDQIKDILP